MRVAQPERRVCNCVDVLLIYAVEWKWLNTFIKSHRTLKSEPVSFHEENGTFFSIFWKVLRGESHLFLVENFLMYCKFNRNIMGLSGIMIVVKLFKWIGWMQLHTLKSMKTNKIHGLAIELPHRYTLTHIHTVKDSFIGSNLPDTILFTEMDCKTATLIKHNKITSN